LACAEIFGMPVLPEVGLFASMAGSVWLCMGPAGWGSKPDFATYHLCCCWIALFFVAGCDPDQICALNHQGSISAQNLVSGLGQADSVYNKDRTSTQTCCWTLSLSERFAYVEQYMVLVLSTDLCAGLRHVAVSFF